MSAAAAPGRPSMTGPRPRRGAGGARGAGATTVRGLRAAAARVVATVGVLAVLAVARAGPAAAAGTTTATAVIGQSPPALSWIELVDSRGVPVWNYELSIDRGGITSPGAFVWSVGADTCWQLYRSTVIVALWFLDWVLAFSWVPVIAAPLLAVGEAMASVVARLGVVPTLLAVAAAIAVVWMVRGRWATGIWELAMTCVIASLALGVFASPVALVAGPDGAIMGTQRAALDLSAQITPGDAGGGDAASLRAAQSAALVDTFVRQPTQLVNFGQVLDGGPCQGAYDEVLAAGPHGYDDDIAEAVGGCNEAAGDYAKAPSAGMVLGAVILVPAALAILAVAAVLAGSVIAAGISAMYASVKAVVTLVTGLLPGGARTSFFLTATSALVSLAILGLTTIFLSVFLLVIQALFASTGQPGHPQDLPDRRRRPGGGGGGVLATAQAPGRQRRAHGPLDVLAPRRRTAHPGPGLGRPRPGSRGRRGGPDHPAARRAHRLGGHRGSRDGSRGGGHGHRRPPAHRHRRLALFSRPWPRAGSPSPPSPQAPPRALRPSAGLRATGAGRAPRPRRARRPRRAWGDRRPRPGPRG